MTRSGSVEWVARQRMHALGLWGRLRPSTGAAVGRLVAMQAQEHPYARWSVAQRAARSPVAAAVDADFDEGRFLRTHVLRPTWHYVAPEDLRWLMELSGPVVHARNARRYRELELDARTLRTATDVIATAVATGPQTRHELGAALAKRRIAVEGQRLPYLLMYAELHLAICSGPVREAKQTYAAFDERVPPGASVDAGTALAELVLRYFTTRGPALLDDFVWWSGLDAGRARAAFESVRPQLTSRTVDDRVYWFAEVASPRTGPRVDLVQCYDEIVISYRASRDVLETPTVAFPVPRHLDGYVHVLLLDGRLLGHWRAVRDRDGLRVETRLAGPAEAKVRDAVAGAVERYRRFAG